MFYRTEGKKRYDDERNYAVIPHGRKFAQYEQDEEIYQIVQDKSAQTGATFGDVIANIVARGISIEPFTDRSAAFWAHLCERVRLQHRPDLPSRLTSVFAFQTIEDAESLAEVFERESIELRYPRPYRRADQVIYEVVCEEPQSDLQFDMSLIDALDATMNYEQASARLLSYWNGERSQAPLLESLLVGKVLRGKVVV
ncbi:DUF2441 domain-containing protein [Sphingomonas sp. 2R-10]|uniref:DUF2441 domain-containing protein n=1 Tax=Sphingomonas sp. 2R-10 TaxID=3045148 RepID=UPI0024BA62E2|nr:DUF2441 domain-containing protein [Sphingomonas sp. 2R-10]MDJ0276009.1 DUF2441 domain-containing protein [Sphingomonas sp. 2R-10]